MADIIHTKTGTHIKGSDAFLVFKEMQEGRELPKPAPPPSKTKTRKTRPKPVTITVVARPQIQPPTKPKKAAEDEGLSNQKFERIKQIIKEVKEVTNG